MINIYVYVYVYVYVYGLEFENLWLPAEQNKNTREQPSPKA